MEFFAAMGKWYYQNKKYQFNFAIDTGIIKVDTIAYEKGIKGITSSMTSKFLNYKETKMPAPISGTGSNTGKNTYIVFTNK